MEFQLSQWLSQQLHFYCLFCVLLSDSVAMFLALHHMYTLCVLCGHSCYVTRGNSDGVATPASFGLLSPL